MGKKNKKNKYCDNGSASMEHYYYENGQNRNSPQFNNFHRSGNFKQSHDYGSYSRYNKEYNSNSVYKKPFKRKMPSRPPSPVLGSEEHMNLKIKQTSAIIMRQLLSPDESIVSIIDSHKNIINKPTKDVTSIPEKTREKSPKVSSSKKNKRKLVSSNAEEIHDKIMHHLSKMNDGRRRNLIYSSESGYDEAIQQIVKQKRIEISRALRDMCSETSNLKESTDIINSIIPDIGIKIEDLPQELLEELQSTFDFECESSSVNYYHMNPGSTTESPLSEVLLNSQMNFEEDSNTEMDPNKSQNFAIRSVEMNVFKDLPPPVFSTFNTVIPDVTCTENHDFNFEKGIDSEKSLVSACTTEVSEVVQQESNEFITKEGSLSNMSDSQPRVDSSEAEIDSGEQPLQDKENSHAAGSKKNCKDFRIEDQQDIENSSDVMILDSKLHEDVILSEEETFPNSNNCDILLTESVTKTNPECSCTSTQTEAEDTPTIETVLQMNFPGPPRDLSQAVERMYKIDQFISELVKYRQSLFTQFMAPASKQTDHIQKVADCSIAGEKNKDRSPKKWKGKRGITSRGVGVKKRQLENGSSYKKQIDISYTKKKSHGYTRNGRKIKLKNSQENAASSIRDMIAVNPNEESCTEKAVEESLEACSSESLCNLSAMSEQNKLEFQEVKEKMLAVQVVEDKLLAATESGKIFFCSLEDGHYTDVLEVTKVPISALLGSKEDEGKVHIYVGSFENSLKVYNFYSHCLLRNISLGESVQCMDADWGYIFLGCMRGTIIRYSIKKGIVEYEDKFTNDNIFVIKAAKEGVQRVLLIGSRNAPVVIRAAMTGLHLRTLENVLSPTVYSLIIEKNLVYCGTTNHNILVYNFHNGTLIRTLKATRSKGISCLKIVRNLLFASCHNGNIYVYNLASNSYIDSIEGPGGVILSMEVLENQVVVGTMSFKFASISIPRRILKLMNCQ